MKEFKKRLKRVKTSVGVYIHGLPARAGMALGLLTSQPTQADLD
jgi:hypothetical protein